MASLIESLAEHNPQAWIKGSYSTRTDYSGIEFHYFEVVDGKVEWSTDDAPDDEEFLAYFDAIWNYVSSRLEAYTDTQKEEMVRNMGYADTLKNATDVEQAIKVIFRENLLEYGEMFDPNALIEDFENSLE